MNTPPTPTGSTPPGGGADSAQHLQLPAGGAAVVTADVELSRQPWFPLQPGDVVLRRLLPAVGDPGGGQTFVAVNDGTIDIAGNAMLREVSRSESSGRRPDEHEYLLRYDITAKRWALDSDTGDAQLGSWINAPELTEPAAVEDAKRWAARAIADVESRQPRWLISWEPGPRGWAPVLVDDDEPASRERWHLTEFCNLWFEAGPRRLVVIRGGAVIHGSPVVAQG